MLNKNLIAVTTVALLACTVDPYETGDSRLSYLNAELVELHTATPNKADYAITDRQEQLLFDHPLTCPWANTPDSLYRAMLFYNRTPTAVEPLSASRVSVLTPTEQPKPQAVDPVKLESAWLSADKRYLNLRLGLMTGQPEQENSKQTLELVRLKTETTPGGQRTAYLQLRHDQGGVPQYYTTHIYVSIPTRSVGAADTIRLSVHTYGGKVERRFAL